MGTYSGSPKSSLPHEKFDAVTWEDRIQDKKKIINALTYFGILATCLFAMNNLFQERYSFIAIDATLIVVAVGILTVNSLGYFHLARTYFLLFSNISFTAVTLLITPSENLYYILFIPLAAIPFVLYDFEERNKTWSYVVLSGVLMFSCVLERRYGWINNSQSGEGIDYLGTSISLVLTFGAVLFILHFWQRLNQKYFKKVQEETAQLKALIDNPSEAVWLIDKQLYLIEFNPVFDAFCSKAYGTRPRKGMNLASFADRQEEQDFWFSRYEKAISNGRFSENVTYQFNGMDNIFRFLFNPIVEEGEVTGVACYAKDITHRIAEAEALQSQKRRLLELTDALHLSKDRYKLAIRGANSGIWDWNVLTNEVYHTPLWNEMLGYDRVDEVPIMEMEFVYSLIHPEDRERVKQGIENHLKERKPYWEECRIRLKDGTYRWFVDTGQAQWNPEGRAVRMVGSIIDVHSRKEAQENNRRNSELLSMILENLPVAIARISEEGVFLEAEGTAIERMGLNAEKLIGKKIVDVVPNMTEDLLTQVKNEDVIRFDSFADYGGGENVFDNALFYTGKEFIGFAIDISTMRHFQDELQEQNKMLEKANAELDRFVYSASHDLRSPLQSILGLIRVAKLEITDPLFLQYLEMIGKSVGRLEKFIEEIVRYSRNARMEVIPEPVDLPTITEEALEDIRFLEGAEKIALKVDIPEGISLVSDPARVRVIMNNLVSNAIKYHDDGKPDQYVNIVIRSVEKGIELSVEDNGKGVPEGLQQRIFEMFYRATEGSSGSGLGLYIVKEAIEKLKGTISVTSEEGKGTAFHVFLPEIE